MKQLFFNGKRSFLGFLVLIQALLASGCALLNVNQQIDELSAHVESVFRHQNLVIDKIMLANEDIDEISYKMLSQAELKMYDQCHLLNEYAIRERDGLEQDFFLNQQILNSINSCEESINTVEKLLPP